MARKALLPLSVQLGKCESPDSTKSYIFLQFCLLHNGPQLQHGDHHLCQHQRSPAAPSAFLLHQPLWGSSFFTLVICFTIISTTSALHTSIWLIPFFMADTLKVGPSDWIVLTILSKEFNFHRVQFSKDQKSSIFIAPPKQPCVWSSIERFPWVRRIWTAARPIIGSLIL